MQIKKIFQYIEGNVKFLGDQLDLLPDHQREQVLYRTFICRNECVQFGYCKLCGCDLPGKFYVKESCNKGKLFPDLMKKAEWEEFKKSNNIEL
jgi:hypothetical protein